MCIEKPVLLTYKCNMFTLSTYIDMKNACHSLHCLLILSAYSLLSGCSTFQTPQVVNLPVIVPCVKEVPPKPELLFGEADKAKPIVYQIQDMAIDLLNLKGYAAEQEAVITGCQ